jgi:hypothetical protein
MMGLLACTTTPTKPPSLEMEKKGEEKLRVKKC